MAAASRIRGEAAFLEEGGVCLPALLGKSATGTLLRVIVDAAHMRTGEGGREPKTLSISPGEALVLEASSFLLLPLSHESA